MQVRALRAGFYGGDFKQAGAVFTVSAGQRGSWFEPVSPPDAEAVTATQRASPGKPRRGRPPLSGSRPKTLPGDPVSETVDPDLP